MTDNNFSKIPDGMIPGIFYTRISHTSKCETAELGLDNQYANIVEFSKNNNIFQIGECFSEKLSGRTPISKRKVFMEAIKLAKKYDGYIVVDKIDRLCRYASIYDELLELGVKFISTEFGINGDPDRIRKAINFAESEVRLVSERTKSALTVLKQKYEEQYEKDLILLGDKAVKKKLGIPNVAEAVNHISHSRRYNGIREAILSWNNLVLPAIIELRKEKSGKKPPRTEVAQRLNEKGITNKEGNLWTESIIYHMCSKLTAADYDIKKEISFDELPEERDMSTIPFPEARKSKRQKKDQETESRSQTSEATSGSSGSYVNNFYKELSIQQDEIAEDFSLC